MLEQNLPALVELERVEGQEILASVTVSLRASAGASVGST
jgi:hypothetical protein